MYYPAYQRLFGVSSSRLCAPLQASPGYGGIRYPGDRQEGSHTPDVRDWDKYWPGSYPGDTKGDRDRQEQSRQDHRDDKAAGRGGQPRIKASSRLTYSGLMVG
jgi:hypothetical protein